MFDVGFWELLLIGVVTLLVVGPDRLPEVARTAGKWVLKIRRFVAGVKSDFQSELESGELHKILGDQKEQIKELRSMVDSTRKEFETTTKDVVTSTKANFTAMEELTRNAGQTDPAPESTETVNTDPASDKPELAAGSGSVTEKPKPDASSDNGSGP